MAKDALSFVPELQLMNETQDYACKIRMSFATVEWGHDETEHVAAA